MLLNTRLQSTLRQIKATQTLPKTEARQEIGADQAKVLEHFARLPLETFQRFDNSADDENPALGLMEKGANEPYGRLAYQTEMTQNGDTTVLLETMTDRVSHSVQTKYYEVGPERTITLVDLESPGQGTKTDAVYLNRGTGTYLVLHGGTD